MLDADQDPLRALSDALLGLVLPGSEGRRYPLRERIGEGGQGWVFRATWNGSIDVVVKVLRPDVANAEALARFQREANVLRSLSHQASPNPHVVRFYDHAYATVQVGASGKSWDLPFTVLELVDGITLERAIADAQPSGIGLERARRILRHVVLALNDVHAQNIVHRDLKPSNILLASPGGREVAKVTDFGLAKLLDPGMQRTTALAGATVGYAPPEQFENGNLRVGRHTDVFSLAAIFYEMVSGVPAFPFAEHDHPLFVVVRILTEARPAFGRVLSHVPRELAERPDVVAALDAELARALAPDPDARHSTVAEFHAAIEGALSSLSTTPSMPFSGARGGVVVRASAAPGNLERESLMVAKTLQADEAAAIFAPTTVPLMPVARPSSPSFGETPLTWRIVSPSISPEALLAIAVSPAGDVAVGAGPQGHAQWRGNGWLHLATPSTIDPRSFRVTAWLDGTAFFAGASPVVFAIAPDGGFALWRFDAPGIAFHAAVADSSGVLLAGERATPGGVVGIVAEIPLGARAAVAPRAVDVPECRALRAVTRFGQRILACGDGGALALVEGMGAARVARICDAPLFALLPIGDGTAMTVGAGGFVFRVHPTLQAELEAIQTTRDLFSLAQGADGAAWCAGAEQRVLRRGASGWSRMGSLPGAARVRALHVGGSRVLAFADDGGVLEGT